MLHIEMNIFHIASCNSSGYLVIQSPASGTSAILDNSGGPLWKH